MQRQISAKVKAALEADFVRLVMFAFLDFGPTPSDALFAHTFSGDIRIDLGLEPPFNGRQTYHGLGELTGHPPAAQEDADDAPEPFMLALNVATTELARHALTLESVGREAYVWGVPIDITTGVPIDEFLPPVKYGRMSVLEGLDGKRIKEMALTVDDARARTTGGPGLYYDYAQQVARSLAAGYADDGFCKSSIMEDKEEISGPGATLLTDRNSRSNPRSHYSRR